MAERLTVRCACGWGPERRRRTTISRGCPDCGGELQIYVPPTGEPTEPVTLRLVTSELEELAPREHWGREVRGLVAAAVIRQREALAALANEETSAD